MCRLIIFIVGLTVSVLPVNLLGAKLTDIHSNVTPAESAKCVILLHGLARTASSMSLMGEGLNRAGFTVVAVDYPSRKHRIEVLSEQVVRAGVDACRELKSEQLYMVTHSMGGILVRDYLSRHNIPELARVVMLAPPNHGSAVVDNLKEVPGALWLNGPAFLQLGTDENSVPLQLGAIDVSTAVIAGTVSINLFLSTFLENPDDGKVSVSSARLEGMCALLTMPVSHPYIMKNQAVIGQTILYLQTGKFSATTAEYFDCIHQ
ncbi:MAG: esterase/lipase family protein [Granulosicoccus sp.]